ncbi:MAG: energy transducer TonB [Bacteroidota bacterium]
MKALLKGSLVACLLLAGLTFTSHAQNKKAPAKDNKVFIAVDQAASFPGGLEAFGSYLGKTIKYPAVARDKNVQGKVFVKFIVEKDGSLSDMEVKRGIGSGCDQEAMRALKNGPKWKPAMQSGKVVRSQYVVPINFSIS